MNRTALGTVAVAVVVVVAGCGGFASDETPQPTTEPTPSATPTATPTQTPTETATSEPRRLPAGWSETGVENASVALDAHYRAVLTGPATTVTYRSRTVETTLDQPVNTSLDMEVDPGTKRLYASIAGKRNHREAYFADGTLTQWSVRNETVVSRSEARFVRVGQSVDRWVLKSQLLLYRLELNRTVERNGTTALVYDVTDVYDNAQSATWGVGKSGTGRIVVTESGRVLELETTVTYTKGTVRYHYAQTQLGETTVDAPAWLQET